MARMVDIISANVRKGIRNADSSDLFFSTVVLIHLKPSFHALKAQGKRFDIWFLRAIRDA
jgi:hypothetical protein